THSHPDHRGGAGAFLGSDPEIIAFAPKTPALEGSELLQQIQNRRGSRQFGYTLTDEENISQGIGRREGVVYGEHRAFTAPSTVYQEDSVSREIDGILLEMARFRGKRMIRYACGFRRKGFCAAVTITMAVFPTFTPSGADSTATYRPGRKA
ncbi:MAG: hypothetical protein ACLVAW_25175, partial [Eisenbergiella massiliensis]